MRLARKSAHRCPRSVGYEFEVYTVTDSPVEVRYALPE
jgi:hypothetical protein